MGNTSWRSFSLFALGIVSACGGGGGGTAGISDGTATASSSAAVAAPSPAASATPSTRFVYFLPVDEPARAAYPAAIERAAVSVQSWYAARLGGRSFRLADPVVETCRGTQPGAYYATQSWSRVLAAVNDCFGGAVGDDPNHRWVVYASVRHQCGEPQPLGAGMRGVAIVPVQDLQGVAGEDGIVNDCGSANPYTGAAGVHRWVGGLAHELGHALGLLHPASCTAGAPDCDAGALMWTGYANYPDTWLRPQDVAMLQTSPFIGP